jgi:membrane protein DedA with SNARE-associated domain
VSDWIVTTINQFGYAGIFLLMLVEAIFPPIPSELIIPFAGFSAARGELSYVGVIIAASLGSAAGCVPWYLAGRIFGLNRVRWLADRFGRWFTINSAEIDLASRWFHRFGPIIVLFGRLLPIIRTLISVPAGLTRMPVPVFALASLVGIVIWNTVLVSAGYLLAEHYDRVEVWLDPLSYVVLAGVVLLYLYRLITWRPGRT